MHTQTQTDINGNTHPKLKLKPNLVNVTKPSNQTLNPKPLKPFLVIPTRNLGLKPQTHLNTHLEKQAAMSRKPPTGTRLYVSTGGGGGGSSGGGAEGEGTGGEVWGEAMSLRVNSARVGPLPGRNFEKPVTSHKFMYN